MSEQSLFCGEEDIAYVRQLILAKEPIMIYLDRAPEFKSAVFNMQISLLFPRSSDLNETARKLLIICKNKQLESDFKEQYPEYSGILMISLDQFSDESAIEKTISRISTYAEGAKEAVMNSSTVFLSCSQKSGCADEVAKHLEQAGVTVFRDTNNILLGDNIIRSINTALSQAKIIVLILDKDYNSNWTERESDVATLFSIHGKRVIALIADENGKKKWSKNELMRVIAHVDCQDKDYSSVTTQILQAIKDIE